MQGLARPSAKPIYSNCLNIHLTHHNPAATVSEQGCFAVRHQAQVSIHPNGIVPAAHDERSVHLILLALHSYSSPSCSRDFLGSANPILTTRINAVYLLVSLFRLAVHLSCPSPKVVFSILLFLSCSFASFKIIYYYPLRLVLAFLYILLNLE